MKQGCVCSGVAQHSTITVLFITCRGGSRDDDAKRQPHESRGHGRKTSADHQDDTKQGMGHPLPVATRDAPELAIDLFPELEDDSSSDEE